jgi:tRNA-(ms[2]io[6]A)-hydroxylase
MLGLKLPTDPRWVHLVEENLDEILTDHAYCEQKATSTCISIVQNYSDYPELVEKISPIVTEEWGHFRQVVAELTKRGYSLGKQRKDEYVNQLIALERKGGRREDRLLDKLLVQALVEARSCERFKVLAEGLKDPYLQKFYKTFMISEAGHYTLFIDLATTLLGKEVVKPRWEWFLEQEALIISNLEVKGERVH